MAKLAVVDTKGKKVSDATVEQAELIHLVIEEMKEEFAGQY